MKPRGGAGFRDPVDVERKQMKLQKFLCVWKLSSTSNTDVVGLLFCSFRQEMCIRVMADMLQRC